jgi:hypothetical protein
VDIFSVVEFEFLTAVVMKRSLPSRIPRIELCTPAGYLLGVFFDPEYGDDIFLRKVP